MNEEHAGLRVSGWTVSRKILLIVALPVAFQILLLIAIAGQQHVQSRDSAAEVESKEILGGASRALRYLVDVETSARGYALTADPAFLEPFDRGVAQLRTEFANLETLTSGEARTGVSIADLERLAAAVLEFQQWVRTEIAAGHVETVRREITLQTGKKRMDAVRAAMNAFVAQQRVLDDARHRAVRRSERVANILIAAGFVMNLIFAFTAAYLVTKNFTRRIGVLLRNAALLQSGGDLLAAQSGSDELALLDRRFHAMAGALREGTEKLEETNRELESFSYSVSHDLRAPLRAIDGYAHMLEEDHAQHFDDDGRRILGIIRSEAARLGSLIDDLLTLSRLGRKPVAPSPFDMASLIREVFDEAAADRDAKLELGALPPAFGDRALVRQAVMNLVTNALKFSSRVAEPVVIVGGAANGSENIYWVRDRGAGFDSRYTGKLFGVFQRLHSDAEFPGTGVGLAIVRRVVQRHGGRVWAEGEIGKGACFYFTLPKETMHDS